MAEPHRHARWRTLTATRRQSPAWQAGYQRASAAQAFGAHAQALREARGVSQQQLARRLGTTRSHVARLELGGGEPDGAMLARIEAALA